jgi:hypothetical protein
LYCTSEHDVVRDAPSFEVAASDGIAHSARRLAVMQAIAKLALRCQSLDIIEIDVDTFPGSPELNTPHARRVDDGATSRPSE